MKVTPLALKKNSPAPHFVGAISFLKLPRAAQACPGLRGHDLEEIK